MVIVKVVEVIVQPPENNMKRIALLSLLFPLLAMACSLTSGARLAVMDTGQASTSTPT